MDKEDFDSLCETCPVEVCEICGKIIVETELPALEDEVIVIEGKSYHGKCYYSARSARRI